MAKIFFAIQPSETVAGIDILELYQYLMYVIRVAVTAGQRMSYHVERMLNTLIVIYSIFGFDVQESPA